MSESTSASADPAPATEPDSAAATVPVTGLQLQEGVTVPRRRVVAWALWDWATQPLNTVIITFIFAALYLTSDSFLAPEVAALGDGNPVYDRAVAELTSNLGYGTSLAGILIALIAPVLGQRADVTGRRKTWLGGATILLVLLQFTLFFVQADPTYFWFGVITIGLASVVQEIAGVNYNAMLVQVSTPGTVGKVSGLGWGMGYVGGIVAMAAVIVADTFDWWGMSTDNGMAYRVIAVGCAVWTVLFAWPLFVHVPSTPPSAHRESVGFFRSYAVLAKDVVLLWRESRPTFWFLLASAVFRDGLAGVFAFGAVIAARSFGFIDDQVQIFGIAALLVAGLASFAAGRLDDRLGAKTVIIASLAGMTVAGTAIVALHTFGSIVFWIGGLVLVLFVGPAQSASRSFLARVTPAGRESEIFGLYATTGRAVSFVTPLLWGITIDLTGATIWGTFAIIVVILAGLVMMVYVKVPAAAEPVHD